MPYRSKAKRQANTAAIERRLSAIRGEIERGGASVKRALTREARKLSKHLAWLLEPIATKQDLERLREEVRDLRRPR